MLRNSKGRKRFTLKSQATKLDLAKAKEDRPSGNTIFDENAQSFTPSGAISSYLTASLDTKSKSVSVLCSPSDSSEESSSISEDSGPVIGHTPAFAGTLGSSVSSRSYGYPLSPQRVTKENVKV
jgi:hypothetical protein